MKKTDQEPEVPAKLKLENTKKFAIISLQDFERCSVYNWNLNPIGYAQTTFNGITVFLHRFILNLCKGDKRWVDHKNRNKLDNSRKNLRVCTPSQNHANKKSGLVSRCKRTGKWRVRVMKNKKEVFHARFSNKSLAINIKQIMMKVYFGEFVQ